jgi:transposase-like protein
VDDSSCLRYFLEPDETLHRRYEALRAYFVQGRPLQEIATQFGYTYDTLRQVIHQFRTRCRSGTPPPFSPPRAPDVRPKPPRLGRRLPRWPTDDA